MNPILIYRTDRSFKRYLIPDKMEIGVHIKSFSVSYSDYDTLMSHFTQGFVGTNNYRTLTIGIHKYRVQHSFHGTFLLSSFYREINGSRMFREEYGLGTPRYPGNGSGEDKDNYIAEEEIQEMHRQGLGIGIDRYRFTIDVLPGIIWDEITTSLTEISVFTTVYIKGFIPNADVKSGIFENGSSVSFKLIEMANDIPIPKQVMVSNPNGTKTMYDPTVNEHFIRNINRLSRKLQEYDWLEKEKRIVASWGSYNRELGTREVCFELYEGIEAHFYLKYVYGIEHDIARMEPKFTDNHIKRLLSKEKRTNDDAKGNGITSAESIRAIFLALADFTHKFTGAILSVPHTPLSEAAFIKRAEALLKPHFSYEEITCLLLHIANYNGKIKISNLPRSIAIKIRRLANEGKIFKKSYGNARTGDYVFLRNVMGA